MNKLGVAFTVVAGSLVLAIASIGCATGPVDTGTEQAPTGNVENTLSISREVGVLSGTYKFNDSKIAFRSTKLGARSAKLEMDINGKHFDLWADVDMGKMTSDGHDAKLTHTDTEALVAFSRDLTIKLGAGTAEPHEWLPAVEAEYWSESPRDYVHRAITRTPTIRRATEAEAAGVRALSNNDDGITCIYKNSNYNAYFDVGKTGAQYYHNAQVNSNWGTSQCAVSSVCGSNPNCNTGDFSCMGRCGAACGWGAPSSYTLDCLDHDVCGHDFCAAGGTNDANCGDEFDMAQDDWTWGVWNGCSG